jgi:hypothetical protein
MKNEMRISQKRLENIGEVSYTPKNKAKKG